MATRTTTDYNFISEALLECLEDLDMEEKQELLNNLISANGYVLKDQLVKDVENRIEDEAEKNDLCPECFSELHHIPIRCHSNGWNEPPGSWVEWDIKCSSCRWNA